MRCLLLRRRSRRKHRGEHRSLEGAIQRTRGEGKQNYRARTSRYAYRRIGRILRHGWTDGRDKNREGGLSLNGSDRRRAGGKSVREVHGAREDRQRECGEVRTAHRLFCKTIKTRSAS